MGDPKGIELYDIGQIIGKGGFGKVFRGRNRITGELVAIKTLHRKQMEKNGMMERVKNEKLVHLSLRNPRIVLLQDFIMDNENLYLIMELCLGGNLHSYLKKRKFLTEAEVRPLFQQLVEGVQYLQENHIIHRDLKLSNILLTDQGDIKIADFGLAVQLESLEEEHFTLCGTPNYIAPEIVCPTVSHGLKADIWSLGCILYTLLVGKSPFQGSKISETLNNVANATCSLPSSLSLHASSLITSLLEKDPEHRPSPEEILQHSFFNCQVHSPKDFEDNSSDGEQQPSLPSSPFSSPTFLSQSMRESMRESERKSMKESERKSMKESVRESERESERESVRKPVRKSVSPRGRRRRRNSNAFPNSPTNHSSCTNKMKDQYNNIKMNDQYNPKYHHSGEFFQPSSDSNWNHQYFKYHKEDLKFHPNPPSPLIRLISTKWLGGYHGKMELGYARVLSNGELLLDIDENACSITISQDGFFVTLDHATPPLNPKTFRVDHLPHDLVRYYQYAARVLDGFRQKYAKVNLELQVDSSIIEGGLICAKLMQNSPLPQLELHSSDGTFVVYHLSNDFMTITTSNGCSYNCSLVKEASLPSNILLWMQITHLVTQKCLDVEGNLRNSFPVHLKDELDITSLKIILVGDQPTPSTPSTPPALMYELTQPAPSTPPALTYELTQPAVMCELTQPAVIQDNHPTSRKEHSDLHDMTLNHQNDAKQMSKETVEEGEEDNGPFFGANEEEENSLKWYLTKSDHSIQEASSCSDEVQSPCFGNDVIVEAIEDSWILEKKSCNGTSNDTMTKNDEMEANNTSLKKNSDCSQNSNSDNNHLGELKTSMVSVKDVGVARCHPNGDLEMEFEDGTGITIDHIALRLLYVDHEGNQHYYPLGLPTLPLEIQEKLHYVSTFIHRMKHQLK